MFGFGKKAKDALAAGASRMNGRTDILEAVGAACALIAASDGDISDAEVEGTVKAVTSNENLRKGFDDRQIEAAINRSIERAKGGRVGQMGLKKELRDIAGDPEAAEVVLLSALDVAEADGNIGDKEQAALNAVAKELGLRLENYI